MARTKITSELIIEMNNLYLKLGSYAATSRALGGSPSPATIKKYIIPNYIPQEEIQLKTFKKEIPEVDKEKFREEKNWGKLCRLSEEEFMEIKELWNEMTM